MAHTINKRQAKRPKSKTMMHPAVIQQITPILKENKAGAWRVIAPFVTVPKKSTKADLDDEQFSFYLKKKPEVLLRDLSTFMSDSVDLPSLFHETSDVLKNSTKASWVTLYLVDRATNEIYHGRLGVLKERHKVKWPIDEPSIVAAFVAKKQEYVLVEDVLLDIRFPEGIGYTGTTLPKSVLCVPVVTPDGDCFAVIELVREVYKKPFTQEDLRICVMITAWMGVAIHQNKERLALKRQQELNDYLLDLVKCYFEDKVLMEKLMSEVVKFARVTLGAERGSFFIIDKGSDEMIGHLFDDISSPSKKVRFSTERGIAGLVARTGKTVNIKDAYNDSRFNKEIDQKTGFITRSILCMPILGAHGVLGVVQVVNKKTGGCFSSNDENLFKTFSLYCSLAVHYTNVHQEINRLKHQNRLDVRIVHLQKHPCIHDLEFLMQKPYVKIPLDFDSFSWYINTTDEMLVAPQYVLHMLFQLINVTEINVKSMMEFILTVRKFYRDLPYHNFEHAFNVCHCMYAILRRNSAQFSKLEIKALLIACLCHDLDHVGFTNNFLQLIKHDFAQLYESAILENHHWEVTQMLLQNHDDLFTDFNKHTTKLFYQEIQKAIIATDLALYFETRVQLIKLYNTRTFSWRDETHRDIVKSIMMNSCDLSINCKPFMTAKRIADMLYREFYRQGDLEKEMGLCPLSVMDRDKDYAVPDDQIKFLSVVVIPCVEILRVVLPTTKELYLGAISLRATWQDIVATAGNKIWRQDDSIVSTYL